MTEEMLIHLCNYIHARFELKDLKNNDDGRAAKALDELRKSIQRHERNQAVRNRQS